MNMLRRLLVVTLLAGAPLQPALAQETPSAADAARAKELRQQGHKNFDEQRYAEALSAYRRSYELSKDPALLYNIGRSHQLLNEAPEALGAYEDFLSKASADLKAKVQGLDATVAEVRKQVTTLTIISNVAGARVLIRKKDVGVTPLKPLRLLAGDAEIEVLAEGYEPLTRTLSLGGGESVSADLSLTGKKNSGLLIVVSPVSGAKVLVDGRPVGATPTEVMLEAGEHRVTVRGDGLKETSRTVVIAAGDRRELSVTTEKASQPSRWWLWAGAGVLVVGGIVLTAALLTERSPEKGTLAPGQISAPLIRF